MGKGLSDNQKTAVSSNEVKTRLLVTLEVNNNDGDVIRILENDTIELFEYNDLVYVGSLVKRSSIETDLESATEACQVTISNIDQAISSIVANEGDVLTNSVCRVEEIIYDTTSDTVIGDAIELFSGVVNKIQLNYKEFIFTVERTIGGYNYDAPRTSYDVSCQWVFKDERCGYTGSLTTCDKTFTACAARGRQTSFGGYPSIPVEMVRK